MREIDALVQLNFVLEMERAHLSDIPDYPLPDGYTLHWYEPGDEKHWLVVQRAAEEYLSISPELFVDQYGKNTQQLHQRLFFLRAASGATIATSASWFTRGDPTSPVGRIHWVAITPEYQGRGLGNPLMSIACQRLRQLGHTSARLTTSTARIPAINLYLKFGFRPIDFERTGQAVWRRLQNYLKEPHLL
ncbi:MAG: GNAT family N-acetyltransferase [Chloroflexi bacterium]|nr:GNAT family N-acetyltransferase [Chloroflexota bacterium]